MEKSRLLEIKPVGLFHTPVGREYIDTWIEKQPEAERPSLWTASLMTHNLLAKQSAEANDSIRSLKPELAEIKSLLKRNGAREDSRVFHLLNVVASSLDIELN